MACQAKVLCGKWSYTDPLIMRFSKKCVAEGRKPMTFLSNFNFSQRIGKFFLKHMLFILSRLRRVSPWSCVWDPSKLLSKWAYAQSAALRSCVTGSCCKGGVHVKIVLSFAAKIHCMKPACTFFCTCVCKFAYRFFYDFLMNFRSPRHPEALLKHSREPLGTQDGLRGLPGTNFHWFWGSFWDPWGNPGRPCGRPGALPGHFFCIFGVTFSTFSW